MNPHVVLIDNHDSFVYNLVDALAGYNTTVFRNTVPVEEVIAAEPDIIILSPGPGQPRDAGSMMQLIDASPTPPPPPHSGLLRSTMRERPTRRQSRSRALPASRSSTAL